MADYSFEAVIFDLDGVITKTALVHSRAWKKMFDDYLLDRQTRFGEAFREFTQKDDYLPYVDGKPRYEGVKSFLASRGIELPFGTPEDDPANETVCGLGNRKNITFNEVLDREGVSVYDSTVKLMRELRAAGIRVGVASSSKNCFAVLKAADLLNLIETRVDGEVSAQIGLKGKPAPDIFLTACANLNCNPARSIVVEDAVSGVAAGRAGNFGLVLGIAREENENELYENGADIVVRDLEELTMDDLDIWFDEDEEEEGWEIVYNDYDPKKERTREALLTIGNGYIGTRGAMEEQDANPVNYPGTYIAGLYNRLTTVISGRDIENEDFVNCPNWLPVTFKINKGEWFDIRNVEIISIERSLSLGSGLMEKHILVRDKEGNETEILSERFFSMHNPHLGGMRYSIIPVNYSGKLTFKVGIDGDLINDGVERYKALNQQHLKPVTQGAIGNLHFLEVETTQSGIRVAEAVRYGVYENETLLDVELTSKSTPGKISGEITIEVKEDTEYTIEKRVAVYTSLPEDAKDPLTKAKEAAMGAEAYDLLLFDSIDAWNNVWKGLDIRLEGDAEAQKLLRLHLYHLMVSMSQHNRNIDASITARGLHGEAYRGHIFWDELFILPLYNMHLPETSKSMLMYRYRRLDKAREYAKEYGFKGAMFPWQSGSDGREETQVIHLNPLSGNWDPDHSSLQRHVALAIAYNTWQYFNASSDLSFLKEYGAEMFLEICRFWASKSKLNETTGRYSIDKVMGPDEFHEQYPDSNEGGLRDNAYINIMVAWMFRKAETILDLIGQEQAFIVKNKIGLAQAELDLWKDISHKLNLCINSDGIIAQYDGYFELKELDWDYYKQKYQNIYRMDRILKAENLSPDEFKVAKQADMLMTFYNLDKEEVDELIAAMGYKLPQDYLQKNLDYYLKRTSHGSTLSRVVHAKLGLLAGNPDLSWELYSDALSSDFNDIQGGTTGEGIHAGVMAGTVLIALTSYAGVNCNGEILKINPQMPESWKMMEFGLHFKGVAYAIQILGKEVRVIADKAAKVEIMGKAFNLKADVEAIAE
ncbi:MAG: beta-phosphoglucomutase family hydrolase [Bacteroidales bacterium]|nr:beta-phosphoglucomutase family hydrolase [Bacteroidales bacterium]